MLDEVSTAMAMPNIAFVKYWGKRDERLVLPANSSLSMTLDYTLNSTTSVIFSSRLKEDVFYLNGKRMVAKDTGAWEKFAVVDVLRRQSDHNERALVVSKNSFPTASGLASSASGVAALVCAASNALGLELSQKELSMVARRGSGSACRSLFGGIVKWNKGEKLDGSDSYAEQVVDEAYWPEVVDVIGIITKERKKVLSRSGMKQTTQTSVLYPLRIKSAEQMVEQAVSAIMAKDFDSLAEIIMRDSNNMHAVMLDTWPPITYLNDTSRAAIVAITDLNESQGKNVAAYTFDAGPHPQVITTARNAKKIKELLSDIPGIRDVLISKAGSGPKLLGEGKSLINQARLAPRGR